jgi:hypothetical protein
LEVAIGTVARRNLEGVQESKNKVDVHPLRPITQHEFFIFIGIIIFSGAIGKGGKNQRSKIGKKKD